MVFGSFLGIRCVPILCQIRADSGPLQLFTTFLQLLPRTLRGRTTRYGGNKLQKYCENRRFCTKRRMMNADEKANRVFPTMKPLEQKRDESKAGNAAVNVSAEAASVSAPSVQIDLTKVKIEPLFADEVDFETFSKSDFRVVKIEACEAVPKSKKLLKFTLNDGTDRKRTILSGIHEYYEPEELVGKTCVAITNLPSRKMMGIDSEGMLISAVYEYDGREGLNLLMLDDNIPAGAKLY